MQTTLSPIMASDICHSLLTDREKTLEKLYARAYPMVLHYVKQHYGTAEDAKDLLQEAIILFYEKLMHDQLTLTSSITTYIMGICKNLWKRELEKRSRNEQLSLEMNDQVWEETENESDLAPLKISSFVDKLGEKCKDILLSFYYFGQRMEYIAKLHDYQNVHTATVQKFKCLERLRKSVASLTIHHFK